MASVRDEGVWIRVVGGSILSQLAELLTLGHVFTRIATEQQARPPRIQDRTPSFRPNTSFYPLSTGRQLYAFGGLKELYLGLRWNVFSSCGKAVSRWSLTNLLYTGYDQHVPKHFQDSYPWIAAPAIGFMAAFLETTFILCPLENMRTKEMTSSLTSEPTRADSSSLVSKFTRGWDRVFTRQVAAWISYLTVYDVIRNFAISHVKDNAAPTPFHIKALVGIATGATSCCVTTPIDMLRTQVPKCHNPHKPVGQQKYFFAKCCTTCTTLHRFPSEWHRFKNKALKSEAQSRLQPSRFIYATAECAGCTVVFWRAFAALHGTHWWRCSLWTPVMHCLSTWNCDLLSCSYRAAYTDNLCLFVCIRRMLQLK